MNESHVRPEIQTLVARGNVTLTEYREIRCNSYEHQALVPALNDEAFVVAMQHALDNCFTGGERPFSTYNKAVEGLYAPELLRRFRVQLNDEQLVQACKNIGFDLTCGGCAEQFYTGSRMHAHDESCATVKSPPAAAGDQVTDVPPTAESVSAPPSEGATGVVGGDYVFVIGWGRARLTQGKPAASIGIREPFVPVEFDGGSEFLVSTDLIRHVEFCSYCGKLPAVGTAPRGGICAPCGHRYAAADVAYERNPDGNINNCALANGDEQKNCQVCKEQCPDRGRLK